MKLETQDDQLMALAAFRYCLGRRSYIVGSATKWLRSVWSQFDDDNLKCVILRDIVSAIIDNNAGAQVDIEQWTGIVRWAYPKLDSEKHAWLLQALEWKSNPIMVTEILGIDK